MQVRCACITANIAIAFAEDKVKSNSRASLNSKHSFPNGIEKRGTREWVACPTSFPLSSLFLPRESSTFSREEERTLRTKLSRVRHSMKSSSEISRLMKTAKGRAWALGYRAVSLLITSIDNSTSSCPEHKGITYHSAFIAWFIFQMETHDKEGTRERYFADDDRYDLKEMVRREKMSTADDQEAMMAKLASKVTVETGSQLCGNYS